MPQAWDMLPAAEDLHGDHRRETRGPQPEPRPRAGGSRMGRVGSREQPTSSLRDTSVRAVGSRLEAASTSLNCTSFFSTAVLSACSLRSRTRFRKPAFCCTSRTAAVNLRYSSSRSCCTCRRAAGHTRSWGLCPVPGRTAAEPPPPQRRPPRVCVYTGAHTLTPCDSAAVHTSGRGGNTGWTLPGTLSQEAAGRTGKAWRGPRGSGQAAPELQQWAPDGHGQQTLAGGVQGAS